MAKGLCKYCSPSVEMVFFFSMFIIEHMGKGRNEVAEEEEEEEEELNLFTKDFKVCAFQNDIILELSVFVF